MTRNSFSRIRAAIQTAGAFGLAFLGWWLGSSGQPVFYVLIVALLISFVVNFVPLEWEVRKYKAQSASGENKA